MQSRYASTSALTKDSTLHYSKRGREQTFPGLGGGGGGGGGGGEERESGLSTYSTTLREGESRLSRGWGEERVWSINIYCNTQLVQAYRIFLDQISPY